LIGGKSDKVYLDELLRAAKRKNCANLAGKLSLLESAALISIADRTHVNDSAPLHLASAMNANVTAYFCSTLPSFGFTPLSDDSTVVETTENLNCRPCGLHGKKECPKDHFDCGNSVKVTI
jgi:ADP-heptose:LPS heptosyltransferase